MYVGYIPVLHWYIPRLLNWSGRGTYINLIWFTIWMEYESKDMMFHKNGQNQITQGTWPSLMSLSYQSCYYLWLIEPSSASTWRKPTNLLPSWVRLLPPFRMDQFRVAQKASMTRYQILLGNSKTKHHQISSGLPSFKLGSTTNSSDQILLDLLAESTVTDHSIRWIIHQQCLNWLFRWLPPLRGSCLSTSLVNSLLQTMHGDVTKV